MGEIQCALLFLCILETYEALSLNFATYRRLPSSEGELETFVKAGKVSLKLSPPNTIQVYRQTFVFKHL